MQHLPLDSSLRGKLGDPPTPRTGVKKSAHPPPKFGPCILGTLCYAWYMNRRSFLSSILAAGVAPAIVRADALMRVVPREAVLLPAGRVWSLDFAMEPLREGVVPAPDEMVAIMHPNAWKDVYSSIVLNQGFLARALK